MSIATGQAARGAARTTRGGVVVGAHRQGDQWRLAAVRSTAGVLSVVETASVAVKDVAGFTAAIGRLKGEVVAGVIPSARTIVRPVDAPPPSGENAAEVAAAWDLLAEAHLPSSVPAHRRGAGRLRVTEGSAIDADVGGVTVAVGWMESATDVLEGLNPDVAEAIERWTPEVAALAALARVTRRGTPGVNLSACKSDGTITLIASSPAGKLAARVLREDASGDAGWQKAINEARGEALASAGMEGEGEANEESGEGSQSVLLELAQGGSNPGGMDGMSGAGWMASFGLAAGAAAAVLTGAADLGTLSAMALEAPESRRHPVRAAAEWFASPARAIATVAACIVVLVAVPVGVVFGRDAILKAKVATDAAGQRAYDTLQKETAYYDALAAKRVPMTKLIADLTGSAPTGIMLDRVTIERGKPIAVSGTALTTGQITTWCDTLNSSGVFASAEPQNQKTDAVPIQFQMTVKVANPLMSMKGGGKGGQPETVAASGSAGESERPARGAGGTGGTRPQTRSPQTRTPQTRVGGTTTPGATGQERATPAKKDDIPPPLTDAQIEALDFNKTNVEWSKRKRWTEPTSGVDAAVRQRLVEEQAKLEAHRDKVRP